MDTVNVTTLSNNEGALMASRPQCRNILKDKNPKLNPKPSQNVLADEIALRDEIFELKREILLLKKSNERNLIKVRKYEDEAKKKDKQIEQLMDPVKNGDVRKLLSTKGAALLLNLKEQNNALIQMVLAKDMQIRKLLSDIKTSKLYTSTKRAESYRHEIDRLRNLLIKSQNTVKESQDMHQRRSVCAGGASVQDATLSSDPSSPRDLEELHFTIQSLEMHMKYSNELLAKKNEQIIQLTDQLNSYQCVTCRKNVHPKIFLERTVESAPENIRKNSNGSERDLPARGEYITLGSTLDKLHNHKLLTHDGDYECREYKSPSAIGAPERDLRGRDDANVSNPDSTTVEDGMCAGRGHESCGGEGDLFDNKTHQIRNAKSISSTNDTRTEPGKHFVPGNSGISGLHRILERASANSLTEEESDVDTEEFEMMEKKIENDQTEIESPVKLAPQVNGYSSTSDPDRLQGDEKLFSLQGNKPDSQGLTLAVGVTDEELDQSFKTQEGDQGLWKESFELENGNGQRERTCQGNHCGTPENCCFTDGADTGNSESNRGSYRYSSDSSFDSQITTGNPVQVEAEINHNSETEEHTKSDGDDDERQVIANKTPDENRGNYDNDNDDDDDVITVTSKRGCSSETKFETKEKTRDGFGLSRITYSAMENGK